MRYNRMAVFLKVCEDFGDVSEDVINHGWGYAHRELFTEEERNEMLFLMKGGHEGCADPYSFSKEDEPYIRECITEALHNNLDGMTEGDKLVVMHFLYDMSLYVREARKYAEGRK